MYIVATWPHYVACLIQNSVIENEFKCKYKQPLIWKVYTNLKVKFDGTALLTLKSPIFLSFLECSRFLSYCNLRTILWLVFLAFICILLRDWSYYIILPFNSFYAVATWLHYVTCLIQHSVIENKYKYFCYCFVYRIS